MNDPESAAARTPAQEFPAEEVPDGEVPAEEVPAWQGTASENRSASETSENRSASENRAAGDQPPGQLLTDHELESLLAQWKEIQAEFVEEPRKAVRDANAIVAELTQRMTQMFAGESEQLESRWADGDDVSTEDLRQRLRRYRSFFERLSPRS